MFLAPWSRSRNQSDQSEHVLRILKSIFLLISKELNNFSHFFIRLIFLINNQSCSWTLSSFSSNWRKKIHFFFVYGSNWLKFKLCLPNTYMKIKFKWNFLETFKNYRAREEVPTIKYQFSRKQTNLQENIWKSRIFFYKMTSLYIYTFIHYMKKISTNKNIFVNLFFRLDCNPDLRLCHIYWFIYFLFARAGEPELVGAGCFWLLEGGAGAAWKKKPGAGAAKKFAGSQPWQIENK